MAVVSVEAAAVATSSLTLKGDEISATAFRDGRRVSVLLPAFRLQEDMGPTLAVQ